MKQNQLNSEFETFRIKLILPSICATGCGTNLFGSLYINYKENSKTYP